jgi:hypothetical protein
VERGIWRLLQVDNATPIQENTKRIFLENLRLRGCAIPFDIIFGVPAGASLVWNFYSPFTMVLSMVTEVNVAIRRPPRPNFIAAVGSKVQGPNPKVASQLVLHNALPQSVATATYIERDIPETVKADQLRSCSHTLSDGSPAKVFELSLHPTSATQVHLCGGVANRIVLHVQSARAFLALFNHFH